MSEVTDEILERMRALGRVAVEGEISGLRIPGSGHAYFDLKDAGAVLPCVIWRSQLARASKFRVEEGMRVVCHGDLDIYKPRGKYSLIVNRVERRGIGEMLARLEELKEELKARGWFARSRPLPTLPRRIGLVTSRDGAAFQDFLRTRSLRWPLFPLRLVHCTVQGEGCAGEIARAIARLDASGVDVIVVARGGGSLEDLWGFNELPVAEAIWRASVPVVSGVGHETDVTLADLVADHRAHTPTDAAQLVVPDEAAYTTELERIQGYLEGAIDRQLERRGERLERLSTASVLRYPQRLLGDRGRRVTDLGRRLRSAGERKLERCQRAISEAETALARQSPAVRLERLAARVVTAGARLSEALGEPLRSSSARLDALERTLEATSPLRVLSRGYSIMRRSDGAAVRRAADVSQGDVVQTWLGDGVVVSQVRGTEPDPPVAGTGAAPGADQIPETSRTQDPAEEA